MHRKLNFIFKDCALYRLLNSVEDPLRVLRVDLLPDKQGFPAVGPTLRISARDAVFHVWLQNS